MPNRADVEKQVVVSARVLEHERHLLEAAAAQQREFLSQYVRRTALAAARRDLADD